MTNPKGESLADIFAEEEARRTEEARREIAKEDAAWNALTPEERERITAERESKWAEFDDAVKAAEANGDEDEESDGDEEDSE